MFLTHRRGDRHMVDCGTVGCPVRHADVDIERCLRCPHFRDLAHLDRETYLYCRPPLQWVSDAMAMYRGGF